MKEEKYSPYSQCCGRPMHYASAANCNYDNSCLIEYPYTMEACIKNRQPDCMAKAVIPSITVETADGITNLANCFVHVTETNTTFYVDDKHRIMIVWAGPVEVEAYDYEANELGLRSQDCYTTIDGQYAHIHFDKEGIAHIMSVQEV